MLFPCPPGSARPVLGFLQQPHLPQGAASPRRVISWTLGPGCQSSKGLQRRERRGLDLGCSVAQGAHTQSPSPGLNNRAGRGRAGSRCWSPAAEAGSPSACRYPAVTVVLGCVGGCGTSPPGIGLAGAGFGRSEDRDMAEPPAEGPTSPDVLPPCPEASAPVTHPAPLNECLLCTRPGDTAVTTLTESSGGQSTNT